MVPDASTGIAPERPATAAWRPALGRRVGSIDVYRGIVMLLLVPNPHSALAVKEMADRNPGDPFWAGLARLFTHVPWTGASVWDLVMPSFVFLIGASMPLSYAARARTGESHAAIVQHAVLRAIALTLLGIIVTLRPTTYLEEIWPLLLIFGLGLPIPALLGRLAGADDPRITRTIETAWWCGLLAASFAYVLLSVRNPNNYEFNQLLVQVGLAYVPAFLLVNRSLAVQGSAAMGILVAYWVLFALYPVPAAGFDLSGTPVPAADETFSGLYAHWNKNANAAAAFDILFFGLFPRTEPYRLTTLGLQVLNFVPMISTIVFGIMAGQVIAAKLDKAKVRNALAAGGLCLIGAGWLAASTVCPLVKSLWTPSWAMFSAGCAMSVLALLFHLCDLRRSHAWAFPFAVAGANSILLYVLSFYTWRILEPWQLAFGPGLFAGYWGPLLEAATVGLTIWLVGLALYRLRIPVRI